MNSDVFCYSNGAAVERESVDLAAYLEAARNEKVDEIVKQGSTEKPQEKDSRVELLYVKRKGASSQGEGYQPPDALPIELGERLGKPSQEADKFEALDRDFADYGAPEEGLEEWEDVLENCGALYGWYVDRQDNKIVQAPMPEFRLRHVTAVVADSASNDTSGDKRSESGGLVILTDVAQSEPSNDTDHTAMSTGKNNAIAVPSKNVDLTLESPATRPTVVADALKIKPRFHVNDNSKIEIIVSSHEFETSMATNDFSAQSTEASVSGGFGGFGASVSAGYASSESSTSKVTNNKYERP
ncbi:hypothetical protein CLAFUW4_09149 [Fulvia fulva]|nr:hypothetical protein CLAFUR4_09155 [Fulvia fulva]KAK4615205.1 hypothetical protein CLAFUR0_09147 [Fulvia fulva]WPV20427.1 hypothetical protein CLAFUW4_09149 [Fulvia fulva]WPV35743.1 hypothetical protein CLAFUW7_09150 [Fulvia fulva]